MRPRRGVSTYLQTFILVSVALAGSAAVARVAANFQATAPGPSVQVHDLAIRQGQRAAVVRFVVSNTGQAQLTSFTVLNLGVPSSASYCYFTWNAATMAPIAATCPALSVNPASISFPGLVPPGGSVHVDLVVMGTQYVVGRAYSVQVVAVPASQSSQSAVAIQA